MTNFRSWSKKQWTFIGTFIVLCVIGVGGWRLRGAPAAVPTTTVTRIDFVDTVQLRGEVKALRSVAITAPADASDFQIVKIAQDGAVLKKGDLVVEFDRTRTVQELAQNRSVLKSSAAEIEQADTQGRLAEEQNLTTLTKSRFDVDSAKLEASKQEIVSHIEGEEAKLKLADAEQKLREAEVKVESDRVATEAKVRLKKQDSTKASYQVKKAERGLASMTVRSPQDGTVTLEKVWKPEGQGPFRPGDRAWPGAPIAQIPDISSIRISARVDESERGRLKEGMSVSVQLDAVSDKQFIGRITTIGTIASADFSAGWPFPKNFNLEVILQDSDPRLRPGMSAQLSVEVDRIHDVLVVPSSAVIQRSGKSVVYKQVGRSLKQQAVEVGRRSGDRVVVTGGIQPGDRLALRDPEETKVQ